MYIISGLIGNFSQKNSFPTVYFNRNNSKSSRSFIFISEQYISKTSREEIKITKGEHCVVQQILN